MDMRTWLKMAEAGKLLITDSVQNTNRLIKRINREGEAVCDVNVTTVTAAAKELLIHDLASRGEFKRIREAGSDIGAYILEGILRDHADRYTFVPQDSLCTATAAEILSNLNLIRENRMSKAFTNSADVKVVQLRRLIVEYEKRLEELGLYDRCMLLKAGIEVLTGNGAASQGEETSVGITSGKYAVALLYCDKRSVLEDEFLKAYAPEAVELTFEEVPNPTWHFYKSYSIWNEAEYVLNDIRTKKIPFGDVRIVYTSSDFEMPLLAAFGERHVPIGFTSGRPISGSPYIRMLLSLVKWAQDGYRYEDLKSLVLNPIFNIPTEDKEKRINAVKEFLKGIDDKIGLGLERYKNFLREAGRADAGRNKFSHSDEYIGFLRDVVDVFDGFEDASQSVEAAEVFESMLSFARKYSRRSKENGAVRAQLQDECRNLAYMLPVKSLDEALSPIEDRLENMRMDDAEAPCAVAACRINGTEVLDRPYIYVIGLADRHYGVNLIESPVLNDAERQRYFDLSTGNVTLSKDKPARRQESYEKSLAASVAREIHMGYCCFDTVKQEELSPSALFLNMRERYGADIEELPMVEYPRVLAEDTEVRSEDVWDAIDTRTREDGTGVETDDVKNDGGEATSATMTAILDGVEINAVSAAFSPSSIDQFLSCPAKYNFQRIRRIPQEEYYSPDSGTWLEASDRGNFFHLIMQMYMNEVFIGKKKIAPEVDTDVFDRIFVAAREIMEKDVPVESEAIAEQESDEIKDAALRYLTEAHEELSKPECPWHVLACEKKFGMDEEPALRSDYEYIVYATEDPEEEFEIYEINSHENSEGTTGFHKPRKNREVLYCDIWQIEFRGQIDRLDGYVDEKGEQHYRIIDYKTGNHEYFKNKKLEKTLQHHIYRMYMARSGGVDYFAYHFPFEDKKEDRELKIEQFKDPILEDEGDILRVLHDGLVDGYFYADTKNGGCEFCDYRDICISKIEAPEG